MPSFNLLDPANATYRQDRSLLREVVNNFALGYELLRELVSNAWDAEATHIAIVFTPSATGVTIDFWDNGHGMVDPVVYHGFITDNADPLQSLFQLTGSAKKAGVRSIGRKGLGAKIGLLSEGLEVESIFKDEAGAFHHRKGSCDEPWQRISADNTAVSVDYDDTQVVAALPATFFGNAQPALRSHITGGAANQLIAGTRVTVRNFQHPEFITLFTGANAQRALDDVERYMKWHTAAGTLAHHWNAQARRLEVHLGVFQGGQHSNRGFTGVHDVVLTPQPYPAAMIQQVSDDRICPEVPPIARISKLFTKKVEFGQGGAPPPRYTINVPGHGQVTVDVVAWIIGEYAQKDKLWGTLLPRDLFGLNVACDGFIVERRYTWVSSTPIDNFFHVVLNCDELELNADRTRFRASSKIVLDAIRQTFENDYKPVVKRVAEEFLKLQREEEELERLYKEDCSNARNLTDGVDRDVLQPDGCSWPDLVTAFPHLRMPKAEIDVVGLLHLVSSFAKELLPFEPMAMFPQGSDLVGKSRGVPPTDHTTEIETKLSSFFKHGHSTILLTGIACWEIDGPNNFKNGRVTKHNDSLHRRLPVSINNVPFQKPFWALEPPLPVQAGQTVVQPYRVLRLVTNTSTNVPQDLANNVISEQRRIPVLVVSELMRCDITAFRASLQANANLQHTFTNARNAWWATAVQNTALLLPSQ